MINKAEKETAVISCFLFCFTIVIYAYFLY